MNTKGRALKILVLSDSHGHLDDRILAHAAEADEVWHAGDVGSLDVVDRLASASKVLRGVYGNIDDAALRRTWPLNQRFTAGGLRVWITHIAGPAGRLPKDIKAGLKADPVDLLVCGHSHILRVGQDASGVLCMNPGACGVHGFHKVRTMLRFTIQEGKVENLSVIELGARGALQP
ncbi:MAG: metallophosphoesterase family protein [Cryomorphaceae bacterium]|nr:metallophosphoesterase family protein [Cryomorphaceae bacterium]